MTTSDLQTKVMATGLARGVKGWQASALLALQEWVDPPPCPHCHKRATDPPGASVSEIKTSKKGAHSTEIAVPNEAAEIVARVVRLVSKPGGLDDFTGLMRWIADAEIAKVSQTAKQLR